jgi:hypothetical protein
MKLKHFLVTGLVALLASPVALATPVDKKVKKSLDKLGLIYEVDSDNDLKMIMAIDENGSRSQLVFVSSKVYELGELEVREVFSPAARVPPGGLDAATAHEILVRNRNTIIGSWSIWEENDAQMLVFSAKIPADMNRKELRDVIDAVAFTADPVEEMLTGADEF